MCDEPHTRGLMNARVAMAFRSRFKDALPAVNARGFGEALIAIDNPIAGRVPAPDDASLPGWDVGYYMVGLGTSGRVSADCYGHVFLCRTAGHLFPMRVGYRYSFKYFGFSIIIAC